MLGTKKIRLRSSISLRSSPLSPSVSQAHDCCVRWSQPLLFTTSKATSSSCFPANGQTSASLEPTCALTMAGVTSRVASSLVGSTFQHRLPCIASLTLMVSCMLKRWIKLINICARTVRASAPMAQLCSIVAQKTKKSSDTRMTNLLVKLLDQPQFSMMVRAKEILYLMGR